MGSVIAPRYHFSLGWWHYFSLMASQPLGTVMVAASLPVFCTALTSILYWVHLPTLTLTAPESEDGFPPSVPPANAQDVEKANTVAVSRYDLFIVMSLRVGLVCY